MLAGSGWVHTYLRSRGADGHRAAWDAAVNQVIGATLTAENRGHHRLGKWIDRPDGPSGAVVMMRHTLRMAVDDLSSLAFTMNRQRGRTFLTEVRA